MEAKKERTPRVDWAGLLRRTFALNVFACSRCGGRRRVLAYLTAPGGVHAIILLRPEAAANAEPKVGPQAVTVSWTSTLLLTSLGKQPGPARCWPAHVRYLHRFHDALCAPVMDVQALKEKNMARMSVCHIGAVR